MCLVGMRLLIIDVDFSSLKKKKKKLDILASEQDDCSGANILRSCPMENDSNFELTLHN